MKFYMNKYAELQRFCVSATGRVYRLRGLWTVFGLNR